MKISDVHGSDEEIQVQLGKCTPDIHESDSNPGEKAPSENGSLHVETEEAHPPKRRSILRSISQAYMTVHPKKKAYGRWETLLLAYQSLGVVYGDLGTSPLYVFSSIEQPLTTTDDFLEVLSLIIWTLTAMALVKYVFIVLRADDHGEGGTLAVYSLLCRHANISKNNGKQYTRLESDTGLKFYGVKKHRTVNSKTLEVLQKNKAAQKALMVLVMIGTCMVIGDGVLTPAISVLSAIAGIKTQDPKMSQSAVVAISVVILVVLFGVQRFGTSGVSFLFSPIMVAWFVSTALIGVYNIATYYPAVFKALSPHYIFYFFSHHGYRGWIMLGAIVLCITGAEAMFADLGHFNKRAIQIAFTLVVFPSLILTYAGEAAYLIKHPSDLSDAFFRAVPHPVFWPMFIISTLAAIVASQALISATFSIIKQSMSLGCFPRVHIIHTSKKHEGQIYSPEVNYCLMILCVVVVLGFRSGSGIGNAFGVAVMCVMLITTFLVTLVMLVIWDWPLLLVVAFFTFFGIIEGVYLTSVLKKVPQGGWVPFAISAFFLVIMISWNYGRQRKYRYEMENKITPDQLGKLLSDDDTARVPGMCLFYSDLVDGLPPIVSHYVKSVGSLHQVIVFVTVRQIPVRTVLQEERFLVDRLAFEGVYRCVARYGYMDLMNVKEGDMLEQIRQSLKWHISGDFVQCEDEKLTTASDPQDIQNVLEEGRKAEISELDAAVRKAAVFVLGKTTLRTGSNTSWWKHLVIDHIYWFLQKNCTSAMAFLNIPPSQFLQVGMTYEIDGTIGRP